MLRLITDFDGPIMDVSERYYRVYQIGLEQVGRPDQPLNCLSKADFWELKRAQVPERQIGRISGLDERQAETFARYRRKTVHTLPYLKYDQPVPGAIATLERIQALGIDLAVMTMRRERELDDAFARYDLGRFFPSDRRYCLSNDYVKTTDVEDKPRLMERAMAELPPASNWMIGDTEADLAAAHRYSIKAIAVLSGIRNREQLSHHAPHFIVDNLVAAVDLVLDHENITP
ncbi:MAG: HAD family hydrolase [Synechococcales cyanobacterium K44_A2020_017]|nr:HAD family hydrolase [Synechococcales cyanobacterium K32_A2020_035]MBF2096499.1 HAD family hydrolase [Synechococcales cyanobacterium K44_A2020_017]